jgi:hypothetical protein
MFPGLTIDNCPDHSPVDAVFGTKNALGNTAGRVPASNILNGGRCQLGAPMRFSPCSGLGMGARSVPVAAGHSLWTGTGKVPVASRHSLRVSSGTMPISGRRPALSGSVAVVIGVGAQKQMIGIDADLIVAAMADKKSGRDVAVFELIGHPMRRKLAVVSAASNSGDSVTGAAVNASRPQPTGTNLRAMGWGRSVLVDVGPEPLFEGVAVATGVTAPLTAALSDLRRGSVEAFTAGDTLSLHGKLTFPVSRPRLLAQRGGKLFHSSYSPSASGFPSGGG